MPAPVALPSLAGRVILLTGGTSGIGLEAAVSLAKAGAELAVVGRNPSKTAEAVADIGRRAGRPLLPPFLCDMADLDAVRRLADEVLERMPRLHVLVNNAGTVYDTRRTTAAGHELTFTVNHLAPVLLTERLLPRLRESAPARIVNVSSVGHYRGSMPLDDLHFEREPYAIMKAYTRSKLANVMHARHLARRLEGSGVTANALHPGGVATNIWSGAPGWARPFLTVAKWFMLSPEEGSRTITFLAGAAEAEGFNGAYFHDNKERRPSAPALDDTLGEALMAASFAMVGLPGPTG